MSIMPLEPPGGFRNYFRVLAYIFIIIGVVQMLRSHVETGTTFISAAAVLFLLNAFTKRYR